MSYSLQISHGDLVLGPRGLSTVTGANKLVQDLTCAILEPMGTDPLHRGYGSILDGGVDPQGNYHAGIIGSPNDANAASFVQGEIRRLEHQYQGQQITRNQNDTYTYGRSTLTADEALLEVVGIDTQLVLDNMLVTATLKTGASNVPLTLPFTTS